jgi:hypothetical protein
VERNYARRRHRVWMFAMTFAALGWGCWFGAAALKRFAPGIAPGFLSTAVAAGVFAVFGLLLALSCVRARRSWLVFVAVAIFANASLLCLPWIVRDFHLD